MQRRYIFLLLGGDSSTNIQGTAQFDWAVFCYTRRMSEETTPEDQVNIQIKGTLKDSAEINIDLPEIPGKRVVKPRIHISDNNCVSCEG